MIALLEMCIKLLPYCDHLSSNHLKPLSIHIACYGQSSCVYYKDYTITIIINPFTECYNLFICAGGVCRVESSF